MELALEAGADDLRREEDRFEVYTPPDSLHDVQQALEQADVKMSEAELIREPSNTVQLDGKKAEQCLKLLDMLEDHDDVQSVYANLEVDETAETG
jgi:transcriptional/translational regulatory protein YebC/TACO1